MNLLYILFPILRNLFSIINEAEESKKETIC